RDNVSPTESGPNFVDLFEINELKAQTQLKDTVILKLKEKIKSLRADDKESKVEDIETQNLELDHRVTKLTTENKHLKQTYKQLFDKIKSSRIQSKEQCDDLINQVNLKSVEVADLNASLQERVLVITALIEQLKGKAVLSNAVSLNPIDPVILQVDAIPLVPTIATAPLAPRREPIPLVQNTDKPVVTLVYTRKPRAKHVPNKMEPNKSWGSSSNVSTSITKCRLSKSSSGIWTSVAPST
nr:pyruvate, phosphate dikinase regulatory protein, chloroplastic [Tanacetum cinerariifolium]